MILRNLSIANFPLIASDRVVESFVVESSSDKKAPAKKNQYRLYCYGCCKKSVDDDKNCKMAHYNSFKTSNGLNTKAQRL